MKLHEIENLPHAELKARRDELTEAAKGADVADLAARYVQARTDAAGRDEKLGEQGRTIVLLQQAADALTARAVAAESEGTRLVAQIGHVEQQAEQAAAQFSRQLEEAAAQWRAATEALASDVAALRDKLATETARANRLKAEAARNNSAINGAAKLLNDAIAARAVEAADEG